MTTGKKLILTLLLIAVDPIQITCFGQSTFVFQNRGNGLDAPVFDFAGNRLNGTNYVAMLYGGPAADSLTPAWEIIPEQPMPPVPFTFMPGGQSGYFSYQGFQVGAVQITTVACGGVAWLQVRAWDARLGTTYENVVSSGLGGYGESNLFQKQGGLNCGPFVSPPELLRDLQSFSLREVIPEPGSTLLLLLGLPALLFFHRRRTK